MSGRQPLRHLQADAHHLGQRGQALLQSGFQRLSLQQFHGQEDHTIGLADLVNGDDVIMTDGRLSLSLPVKRLRAFALVASCAAIALIATTRWSFSSNARSTIPMPPRPMTS